MHMAGKEWTDSFVLLTNRSDESEPEDRDTVERDALLLAQTYTSQETKVNTPHLNKKYRTGTYLPTRRYRTTVGKYLPYQPRGTQ